MNKGLHFSSVSSEWETPQRLFDVINEVCHFDIDVCATKENAKCERYWSPKDDGLKQFWLGMCWMNPPYGREISKWMEKAYLASYKARTVVVCLTPARTDTAWWHDYVLKGDVIYFRGRLKFVNRALPSYRKDGNYKISAAPFPSALVILGDKKKKIAQSIYFHLIANRMRCAK